MTKSRAQVSTIGPARRAIATVLALAALAALSGCAPSPTTTYVGPAGDEVTVDWADYPGSPGVDADDVLSAPPQEATGQVASELFAEIERALGAEFDLDWERRGEAQWFPGGGNGYGGESAYVTFNSQDHVGDTVPGGADDWRRIVEIVGEATEPRGLGPVELDHERAHANADELLERFGAGDPDEYWQWTGTAYGSSQWLAIALTDVSRDGSGAAAEDWEDVGWGAQSIAISYGATTLPEDGRAGFERRLAPFEGLVQPPTTTSD